MRESSVYVTSLASHKMERILMMVEGEYNCRIEVALSWLIAVKTKQTSRGVYVNN